MYYGFVFPTELFKNLPLLHRELANGNKTADEYIDDVREHFNF